MSSSADQHTADHGHGHDHPPHLAHHFETPKQQFESGKLGMWLFLATEVLLFGGLFCAYAVWRGNHPELFKYGSEFLDTAMGATNTAILILSSLTMAMAVTFAQKGKQTALVVCLILTLAGAAGFMVIKYFEYTHKFHEGWYPGVKLYEKPHDLNYAKSWDLNRPIANVKMTEVDLAARAPQKEELLGVDVPGDVTTIGAPAEAPSGFNVTGLELLESDEFEFEDRPEAEGPDPDAPITESALPPTNIHAVVDDHVVHPALDPDRPRNTHMFFNIYFMMTGLHGIHVVIGGIVIIWLLVKSLRGEFGPDYFTPVDLGGLYWHVVDLIWIFLFPLFYLI